MLIAAFIAASTVGSVPVLKVGVIVKAGADELTLMIPPRLPTATPDPDPAVDPRRSQLCAFCRTHNRLPLCALDATVLELQQHLCRPPGSRQEQAFNVHRSGLLTEDEKNSDTLLGQMPAYVCGPP